MKKIIIISIAVAMTVFASSASAADFFGKRIKATGKSVTEVRTSAMKFDKIEVSRSVRLIVEERTTGDIEIRADEAVMPYVKLSVRNGMFKATLSDEIKSIDGDCKIAVSIPNNGKIKNIGAYAAGTVTVKPRLEGQYIELSASGASKITATVKAVKCDTDASGASKLNVTYEGGQIDIDLSGASKGEFKLAALKSGMEISGASSLSATGSCNSVIIETSGASKADIGSLKTEVCEADASGASKITLNCSKSLSVEASGASKIAYYGDCRIASSSVGSASNVYKK